MEEPALQKINLKARIFIYFAIAAIIPSLLFWIFIYARMDTKLQSDYKSTTHHTVQKYMKDVDRFFDEQANLANSIARAYTYIDHSPRSISNFLSEQSHSNEHFLNMYIINNNDQLILDNGTVINHSSYKAFFPYQKASAERRLIWLEPYRDYYSGNQTLGMAVPVYDKLGYLDGVLVVNLAYGYFEKVYTDLELQTPPRIFLVSKDGDIQYSSSSEDSGFHNIAQGDFILNQDAKSILNLQKGTCEILHNHRTYLCTFARMQATDWRIVVLYDTYDLAQSVGVLNKVMYSFITFFGAGVLILVVLLSVYLSNSISLPLMRLKDGVQEFSLGNLEHVITIKGMEEIRMVADTFNQMSYNLKKSYRELFNRTDELYEKNEYLQELNAELEASYEQLGATLEQLNQSEEKYRKLISNISDLVIVLNNEAQIVYVNIPLEKQLGLSQSELIGMPIMNILGSDANKQVLEQCYSKDSNKFQITIETPLRGWIHLEGSTRRLVEHGNIVGIQGIVRDITQRRRMEETLCTRYNELQAINEITNAITRTMDIDEMLGMVVSQVMNASQALCCTVSLYNEENNDYVLKAIHGIKLDQDNPVSGAEIREQVLELMENQKHFLLELKSQEMISNEYFKLLYKEEGARFILFTPLIAHEKNIGLMSTVLKNRPEREMTDLVTSMGNSIALSIDNANTYEKLKGAYLKTVQSLVNIIEAKDMYTESHSVRVAQYATFIATELNMDKADIENIWVAGVLHDIGKIGISDAILNKKEWLTPEEYELVKQHPVIAHRILSNIGLEPRIMKAIRHHHERYDGKGYPDGLAGENIDLMASIISVADSFDAITSQRSYKNAKTMEEGIQELIDCKGIQFHPDVVNIFSRAFKNKRDIFIQIHSDKDIRFF
jgi:PAS domain S-box-containing protein/putative nucleotidyltransferase with HDIG domain